MLGSTLRRTPHTVKVIKPDVDADTDTNVGKRDYTVPPATERDVQGMLQITGGQIGSGSDGQVYNYDAMFYTHDTGMEVNDRVEVALDWLTDNFLVLAVAPKTKVSGSLDHVEVVLQRDAKR